MSFKWGKKTGKKKIKVNLYKKEETPKDGEKEVEITRLKKSYC